MCDLRDLSLSFFEIKFFCLLKFLYFFLGEIFKLLLLNCFLLVFFVFLFLILYIFSLLLDGEDNVLYLLWNGISLFLLLSYFLGFFGVDVWWFSIVVGVDLELCWVSIEYNVFDNCFSWFLCIYFDVLVFFLFLVFKGKLKYSWWWLVILFLSDVVGDCFGVYILVGVL